MIKTRTVTGAHFGERAFRASRDDDMAPEEMETNGLQQMQCIPRSDIPRMRAMSAE